MSEQVVTLELTLNDVNVVLTALAKAPLAWEFVNPTLVKIKNSADEQLNPKEAVKED